MADKDTVTPADLIQHCATLFSEALHQFRTLHELILASGLFSKGEVVGVDTVAITFRDLGLKVITVASTTSDQWLEAVIDYYQNLSVLKTAHAAKEMQDLLIGQAAELSKAFNVLSAWAHNLAGQFNKSYTNTKTETDEFVKRFAAALSKANTAKKEAEDVAKKATEAYEAAVKKAGPHGHHHHGISTPLPKVDMEVGHILISDKDKDAVAKARKVKELADKKLQEATKKLKTATSNDEKAKDVASKTYKLIEALSSFESICNIIGTFWKMEHAKFLVDNSSGKAVVLAQDDIAFWKAVKTEFGNFVNVMTPISNSFNFKTDAKLPTFTTLHFEKLDLDLQIPAYLDVKKIMDN